MKEIFYALALVALIGFVTMCNGAEPGVHQSMQPPTPMAKPGMLQPRQPVVWFGPGYNRGFHGWHYQVRSSAEPNSYHTEYAFPEYATGMIAPIVYPNVPQVPHVGQGDQRPMRPMDRPRQVHPRHLRGISGNPYRSIR